MADVLCADCSTALPGEAIHTPEEDRTPCSSCGSVRRNWIVRAEGSFAGPVGDSVAVGVETIEARAWVPDGVTIDNDALRTTVGDLDLSISVDRVQEADSEVLLIRVSDGQGRKDLIAWCEGDRGAIDLGAVILGWLDDA